MINIIVACTCVEMLDELQQLQSLQNIIKSYNNWNVNNNLILALYLALCRPQESSQCFYDFQFLSWFPFRISGRIIQHQWHFL